MARNEFVVRYVSPGHPDGHEFVGIDRGAAADFRRAAREAEATATLAGGRAVVVSVEEREDA